MTTVPRRRRLSDSKVYWRFSTRQVTSPGLASPYNGGVVNSRPAHVDRMDEKKHNNIRQPKQIIGNERDNNRLRSIPNDFRRILTGDYFDD